VGNRNAWKHGRYSAAHIQARRQLAALARQLCGYGGLSRD